ncbi:MAG: flagellar biosynthesis protein FlhB [Alphaproteobacteria bacterium]|nr:flagellar biosynthesis protein FlhB [Alphaproteobacteria bacterium]NDG04493.1 flagellar biosynthesis protein FlhB [Alphaproteobacteria bacterium]
MAEGDDKEQKTEEPTSKRLDEAREKGQLPISREVVNWFMYMGLLISVIFLAGPVTQSMTTSLQGFFVFSGDFTVGDKGLQNLLNSTLADVGLSVMGIFALMIFAALVGMISQTGFFASFHLLEPKFDKISPIAGFQRLFSTNSLMDLLRGIVKIAIVGWIGYLVMEPIIMNMDQAVGYDLPFVVALISQHAVTLLLYVFVLVSLLAAVDLAYTRWQFNENMKMTRQEVKDEHKQSEGDPLIKTRLRSLRMEKARKRMMANVPKADVVITNPTHFAVALQYTPGKNTAPVVLAKGADMIAARIRALAEEHEIPLISNPPLARVLFQTVEIDEQIPAEHYQVVAEIIAYVYRLKRKKLV